MPKPPKAPTKEGGMGTGKGEGAKGCLADEANASQPCRLLAKGNYSFGESCKYSHALAATEVPPRDTKEAAVAKG